jgi:hypothetical protein
MTDITGKGLFGYFGLYDWFYSLSQSDREKIFSYYNNFTTDPNDLIRGEIYYTSNTATKLLTDLARNALGQKDHRLCDLLLDKAKYILKTKQDKEYYDTMLEIITQEKSYIPDRGDINIYENKVLKLIIDEPGILQSDVPKKFTESERTLVGYALSQLKYAEKIRRENSGRSFKLYTTNINLNKR